MGREGSRLFTHSSVRIRDSDDIKQTQVCPKHDSKESIRPYRQITLTHSKIVLSGASQHQQVAGPISSERGLRPVH